MPDTAPHAAELAFYLRGVGTFSGPLAVVARSRELAPDHQRRRVVPITVSSTSLSGMAWLVLSNKTLQPRSLNRPVPEHKKKTAL